MRLAHVLDVMESPGHVFLEFIVHLIFIPHETLNVLKNQINHNVKLLTFTKVELNPVK